MVPAQQVQQAVAGQEQQFPLQAVAVIAGLARRGLQGDHDVAQFQGLPVTVVQLGGQRQRWQAIGALVLGGKSQHIGGLGLLAPAAVEVGDFGIAHQAEAQTVTRGRQALGQLGRQRRQPITQQPVPAVAPCQRIGQQPRRQRQGGLQLGVHVKGQIQLGQGGMGLNLLLSLLLGISWIHGDQPPGSWGRPSQAISSRKPLSPKAVRPKCTRLWRPLRTMLRIASFTKLAFFSLAWGSLTGSLITVNRS